MKKLLTLIILGVFIAGSLGTVTQPVIDAKRAKTRTTTTSNIYVLKRFKRIGSNKIKVIKGHHIKSKVPIDNTKYAKVTSTNSKVKRKNKLYTGCKLKITKKVSIVKGKVRVKTAKKILGTCKPIKVNSKRTPVRSNY